MNKGLITSQPVASERLLILIKGVLPMASMIPFFDFFFFFFLDGLQRRSQKKYATTRETKMAVPTPTAPAFLAATGAIFSSFHALGLLVVTNKQIESFYLHPYFFFFYTSSPTNFQSTTIFCTSLILKLVFFINKI